jgi:four helix bundle protein
MVSQGNRGLETLAVWQKSLDYAVDVCRDVVSQFPSEEKWALASQLRRSVQSIPANIAEGYGRFSYQETIRFCYIARGSMSETKTQLILAHRLGYIGDEAFQCYLSRLTELVKMLHGYISHLRNQKSQIKEQPNPENIYDIETDF